MSVWLVRAGGHGEREALALEQGMAVIGWDELPDLNVSSRDQLEELCRNTYPNLKQNTIRNWVGQLWAFRQRIQVIDLVVLPLKTRTAIAIGRVTGPYKFLPDQPEGARHTRKVEWLQTDIPRTSFDQDLLYSFGAFMTVCQIRRNAAEERISSILTGRAVPREVQEDLMPEEITDLEEYAHDQIRAFISQRFRGHELARLVNELLTAQGYHTYFPRLDPMEVWT
jgi:restriction system protein